MWGFWILVFVIQMLRGAAWTDLFVIVVVLSFYNTEKGTGCGR